MITLFSIPKPFAGHTGVIQRNAIRSWTRLGPEFRVVLCGDDDGVAEFACEVGATHVADVARNDFGTPLLSSAFAAARELIGGTGFACYINADIVLLSDFRKLIEPLLPGEYLVAGQRWDLDVTEDLDLSPGWESRLRADVADRGALHQHWGIDYLLFTPTPTFFEMPQFAVGRPFWDNWFIYHARLCGAALVDATQAVTAVHQNHDYGHVKQRRDNSYYGPEADRNQSLLPSPLAQFSVQDATHVLTRDGRVRPALDWTRVRRRLQTAPLMYPWIARMQRRLRWYRARLLGRPRPHAPSA